MQTPRVSVPEVGVAKVTSVRTYVRACNQDVLLQYARARAGTYIGKPGETILT